MKKDRQLVILLAALLVLIFLSSCAAGNNASMTPAATDFAYAEDYSYTRDAPHRRAAGRSANGKRIQSRNRRCNGRNEL